MDVKPLMFAELSAAAQKQWSDNGTDDYRNRIRCCFNCPHWHCERAVDHEYAYNPCLVTRGKGDSGFLTVKFDFWCPDYEGTMPERNLAWEDEWQEVERRAAATHVES